MTSPAQERRSIGPYQILARIGVGSMGDVYLTTMDGPAGFSKLAVVKELQPELRSELIAASATFEKIQSEVRTAARLTHPNVVHTYGAHEEAGRLYLATEYIDGQPWSRVRDALGQTGALPLDLRLQVLVEVLAGLHYAHELLDYDGTALNAVHCDVHPDHVFVTYDGHVKIVDFGLARTGPVESSVPDGTASAATQTPRVYFAPEQARGEAFDRRADVFAVGVLLWEALAGKSFAGDADLPTLRERRARGDEPKIRDVAPDVPTTLAEICDRALALAPDDRFATAAELREALLAYLGRDMTDSDRAALGTSVVNGFSEERAHIHELIESHLNAAHAQPVADEHFGSGPPVPFPAADEVTNLESAQPSAARDRRAWAAKWLPRAGIAAAVAAGTLAPLAVWLMNPPSNDDRPPTDSSQLKVTVLQPATNAPQTVAPPAPQRAPAQPAQPAQPEQPASTLQLKVSASPPGASLLLDGAPLNRNPVMLRHAIDHELHVLSAAGPGYQSEQRVIAFDGDHSVTFELKRVRETAERRARTPSHPRRGPARAASSPRGNLAAAASPPRADREDDEAELEFDAALSRRHKTRPIDEEDPYR